MIHFSPHFAHTNPKVGSAQPAIAATAGSPATVALDPALI